MTQVEVLGELFVLGGSEQVPEQLAADGASDRTWCGPDA